MYFTVPPSHESYVSVAIITIHENDWKQWRSKQSLFIQNYLHYKNFKAQEDTWEIIPSASGEMECIVLGYSDETEKRWCLGQLVTELPTGYYHIESDWSQYDIRPAAVGWGLGLYQFLKTNKSSPIFQVQILVQEIFSYLLKINNSLRN